MNLFLSASVPLPTRNRDYFRTADVTAIREAIKALVEVALPKAVIVFGGHPAITPLVAMLLRGQPVESRQRVVIFQSAFFEAEFIAENSDFIDFNLTPARPTEGSSVSLMREEMLHSRTFDAAFFIGGMEGVEIEYRAFRELYPLAPCYPIASTGAAALRLYDEFFSSRRDLVDELTYPTLFRNLLSEISRRDSKSS